MGRKIYLIGALKNRSIVDLENELEQQGHEPFAQWQTPGPDADSFLLEYAKKRGWTYKQALKSKAALHIFEFDKKHIEWADTGIIVMPAGKSAHLELGVMHGQGKDTFILFDQEPERFDLMYNYVDDIFFDKEALFERLKEGA